MAEFKFLMLWPTYVLSGSLDEAIFGTDPWRQLEAQAHRVSRHRFDARSEGSDLATQAAATHISAALREQPAIGAPTDGEIVWQVEEWPAGYGSALRPSSTSFLVMVCLARRTFEQEQRSGSISLHDPRAGCANVPLPGLPYGRPLTVPMRAGAYVVFPGWLRHGVLPVALDDACVMAVGHYG